MMKNGVTLYNESHNPGLISHNEMLKMFREIVDPNLCGIIFS